MNGDAPLQKVKPKSARTARALKAREPLAVENPRTALFLRYTTCSELIQLLLSDLTNLRKPHIVRFSKKNNLHPFEDASSFEFFSEKNDASLLVFGSHTKKRPNCVTFMRMFEHKVLDMLELMVDAETARTMKQFKGAKPAVGLKPLVCFSGAVWESPVQNEFTLAKSLLLDFFKGEDVQKVDVEGLQYMVHVSAAEEIEGQPKPQIHLRVYMIRTKRSGSRLPRVEVEEIGPRVDFRIGRVKQADEGMLKEAMKRPRGTEAKTKKNVETDVVGDKVGRIYMGRQDLSKLQTRKMKGLKRGRDLDVDFDVDMDAVGDEMKKARVE
ncbi:MAG: hypothetical protein Q9162_007036 [Coniocarpon cinnabarinum]